MTSGSITERPPPPFGARGLVARANLPLALEALEVPAYALGIVGDPVHPEGVRGSSLEDGGGKGILVDIESHPDDCGRHGYGLVSSRLRPEAACGSGVACLQPAR